MKPKSQLIIILISTVVTIACLVFLPNSRNLYSQDQNEKRETIEGAFLDIADGMESGTLFKPELGTIHTLSCVERLGKKRLFNFQFRDADLRNKNVAAIYNLMDSICAAQYYALDYYMGDDTAYLSENFKANMYFYKTRLREWQRHFNSHIRFSVDTPVKETLEYGKDFYVYDDKIELIMHYGR